MQKMLAHVGEKGFEGSRMNTKYYQRNIRMYSNLNRINLPKNDRVFFLGVIPHNSRDFIS
jgi:hypothetical protein